MTPSEEPITPETAALIPSRAEPLILAELDRLLDALPEGTKHIAPLPADFSRADIYGDHP